MPNPSIKNILFDLGGVLIDWDPRYMYKSIFSKTEEMETFLADVCTSQWNSEFDAGKPFAQGVEELSAKFPKFKKEIEAYDSRWDEMINGEISPTVEVLKKLKESGKYRILALSNWSEEKFVPTSKKFPFLKLFEEIVISGKIGMIKPHQEIFDYVLEKFGISPKETVFIDDAVANIKQAKDMGFRTIRFTKSLDLKAQLKKFSVSF